MEFEELKRVRTLWVIWWTEKCIEDVYEVWVIDQVWGQDGWILAKFFFCVFMDRDEVEVHKRAKKRTRPIFSHLDRTNLGRVRLGIFRNKNVFRNIFRQFCSCEQNSQNGIQVFRNENSSQTNVPLVNKGFIIWLLVKFCLWDTAGSPERARWLHLARSGSQSQRAIWFILPAHGASHVISMGYWPSVRSRWLDIGQVLFLRVYGPRRSRGP